MNRWLRRTALLLGSALLVTAGDVRPDTDPFAGQQLYRDPVSPAVVAARQDSRLAPIAAQPAARWFDYAEPDSSRPRVDTYVTAAAAANALPVLVIYGVPHRDCGQFSAGGAPTAAAYRAWVAAVAAAIGSRRAVVVVEPDALANTGCLAPELVNERLDLLRYAVDALSAPRITVYVDGGNAHWLPAAELARRLRAVDVGRARGFSVNVANFYRTDDSRAYGDTVARLLSSPAHDVHYVVDTSRNGAGPPPDGPQSWCNPADRRIGARPGPVRGAAYADALLWVKPPGESDGACGRGEPAAGQWWPDYALSLVGAR
ncbi:glycoside hydrolase family 6 protein [Nocardia stercoris]|uniref:Glucanase n=1 Tax=Nocardia stercoris TaxID=2483361 RepID=A0A3M2L207_9NOCA|nr:glycoside hydrolase family 6 protein [Nocardia stercoris]RMI31759.1 1,4-beta-glucanase [Nocardia stercoris]